MTQKTLAREAGIGLRTLRRLEAGQPTSLDSFLRTALALGLVGAWTGKHQMSVVGKQDNFERSDLLQFAHLSGIRRVAARRMADEVIAAVADCPRHARDADVQQKDISRIGATHRTRALAA